MLILCCIDIFIKVFCELVDEIVMLMGYEVFCDFLLEDVEIEILIIKIV